MPLETNLEKDTKVVQHEQKKFLQQHKVRMESYQKAVSTMKKQRKKKATPENTEKELRVSGCICIPYMNINDLKSHRKKKKKNLLTFPQSLQLLEDQKKKLDVFCDQSYKNVSSLAAGRILIHPFAEKNSVLEKVTDRLH